MKREKILILVEAVTLYSTGLDHTGSMDDLAVQCTEGEWKFVYNALARAQEIMAGATDNQPQLAALISASQSPEGTAERDALRALVERLQADNAELDSKVLRDCRRRLGL